MNSITYPYRPEERENLKKQLWLSQNEQSRMSLVYGGRYLGKTALVMDLLTDTSLTSETLDIGAPVVYLPLGGKNSLLAMEEFRRHCSQSLGIYVPVSIMSLESLFDFLMGEAWKRPISVVIDRFEEISIKYPDFCQHLAAKWKAESRQTYMNLVMISNSESDAEELFMQDGSPLKGQLNLVVHLNPLSIKQLKEMQETVSTKALSKQDYLTFIRITGGRPSLIKKYLEAKSLTQIDLIQSLLSDNRGVALETKLALTGLLGKNGDTYLSILELIADGVKSQAAMEQRLGGIIIGGHLAKLETEYGLIRKSRPILRNPDSRGVVRYDITDPAIQMWLRLVYKDRGGFLSKMEDRCLAASSYLEKNLEEDLAAYFLEKLTQENAFSEIGLYWEPAARIPKKTTKKAKGKKENPLSSSEEEKTFIIGLRSKKAMIAAVAKSADAFQKEPFFNQLNALKNGPLKGYSIDARLFTLDDV